MKKEMKQYEHIFQDALGMLIKHHPFFGHIMANLVRIEDPNVRLFSLSVSPESKIALHYNLEDIKYVVEELKVELITLTAEIQHTVYHLINEHPLRKKDGKYDAWIVTQEGPMMLFDIACDIAINQYIKNLPETALKLDSFAGLDLPKEENAEYYYYTLLELAQQNMQQMMQQGGSDGEGQTDAGDAGGVLFSKGGTPEDKEQEKQDIQGFLPLNLNEFLHDQMAEGQDGNGQTPQQRMSGAMIDDHNWEEINNMPSEMVHNTIKDMVKRAYHQTKFGSGIGTLPAGVERMIEESMKPAYDFRPLLKRFIDGELFSHYIDTRKRPNRRFGYQFPGKKSVMKAKVGVLADTSGSMDELELGTIAKNLQNINEYAQVILFEVDTCIHYLWEYSPSKFKKILHGGGGTVFNDVFKLLDNYKSNKKLLDALPEEQKQRAHMYIQDIKALIIITDGEVYGSGLKKPRIPVMWALTSKACTPPVDWGKVIYLDNAPEKHKRGI